MTIQNDFLPFAVDGSANVLPQTQYAALAAIAQGFQAGTAQSAACNKAWRQSTIMAAVVAQFIVAETGQPAIDDGTTATLLGNLQSAVQNASRNAVLLHDTGAANAYAAANPVPLTALPTASGYGQTLIIGNTNSGPSTYAPDGLPAAPIFGLGGGQLQGDELVAGGIARLVSYVGPMLNSGALCWVIIDSIGGSQQVRTAHASHQAPQFGQVLGMRAIYTSAGSFTVPEGVYDIWQSGCAGGGGGGGGAGSNGSANSAGGGGGGGYGQSIYRAHLSVTPGQVINVTPGAPGIPGVGGAAGGNAGGAGGAGGNTVIGSTTLVGGSGGGQGGSPTASGGGGGSGYPAASAGADGLAGAGGGAGASGPFGGGGGAPPGASGRSYGGYPGAGYGAGGAGGGACYGTTSTAGGSGGAGTPGFAMIEW